MLRDVTLELRQGETLAVLGPNGAGKTTLLRVLATLLRPTAGEVSVLGCALPRESWRARGRIGYLGHEPLLYRDLTGAENLRFQARLHGLGGDAAGRIAELLDRVRMSRRADELVRNLSAGHGPAAGRLPSRSPRAGAAAARRAALPPRPRGGGPGRAAARPGVRAHRGCSSRTTSTPGSPRATACWRCGPGARSPTRGRPAGSRRAMPERSTGRTVTRRGRGARDDAFKAILSKDLRVELRTLQSVPAMALFAITTFVLFRYGLDRTTLSGSLAAGVLLATVLFAAILAINRLFVAERDEGGFDAIRLAPVDGTALGGEGRRADRLPARPRGDRAAGLRDLLPRLVDGAGAARRRPRARRPRPRGHGRARLGRSPPTRALATCSCRSCCCRSWSR